jgi:1-aminocyclopropane-1-carboxylate deaminase/D-cysteine desulfhydrase-like pyridoxal-dependent ACC family enzyme
MASPSAALAQLPRAGLLDAPTPLHRLPRLSALVGRQLWAKRDDTGPVALAGNKIRKYDLVLGRALADGATRLVTAGAAQSNSARAGAAAAVRTGLSCRLILSGQPPAEAAGNLLLDQLLGAELVWLGDATWQQLEAAVAAASAEPGTVTAPVGCSSPLGALGFASALLEAAQQWPHAPEAIVHASSSLGTHAGLLVGRALLDIPTRIIGIDVAAISPEPAAAADALARQAAALIGLDLPRPGADIRDGIGPGYGVPDARTAAAVDLLARTEAVIADPVYSGKGAAGMLALAPLIDGPILWWHTGGYHALFDPGHARALARARTGERRPTPPGPTSPDHRR